MVRGQKQLIDLWSGVIESEQVETDGESCGKSGSLATGDNDSQRRGEVHSLEPKLWRRVVQQFHIVPLTFLWISPSDDP